MKQLILLICASWAFAQTDQLTVKKIDIFKNGTAFFTSEGRLGITGNEALLSPLPNAAFGTLWIAPIDKTIQIEGLQSSTKWTLVTKTASDQYQILHANIGKKISWPYGTESDKSMTGILKNVFKSGEQVLLLVQVEGRLISMEKGWNARFDFPEGGNTTCVDTLRQEAVKIKTSGAKGAAEFQMVYFQTELGWQPSYRVDLLDEKNAQVVLSSTIVNDAQDISDAQINLVVGFPHFIHANVLSPLTNRISIRDFFNQLNGNSSSNNSYSSFGAMSNRMMAQSVAYEESTPDASSYGQFTALEGKSEEDLFFYTLPKVTLKKGERAWFPIFSATVPYQHIFETFIPSALSAPDGYYTNENSKKEPSDVWHSIKLENTTKNPWTTGSALTLQNGRSLGQDVLNYTPIKSSSTVKITLSPDIRVSNDEKETSRKEEIKKKDGYYYDLVTLDGTITAHNYKDKEAKLKITHPVTGKIIQSSEKPVIKQPATLQSAINQENVMTWEITLKPGEEKKLTFQYELFLRR